MFGNSSNLGFPRRIAAYYLLFCLVAVSWLAIGILLTSHSIVDSRTTNTCLARLGKTVAALELDYLRNGTANLQNVLQSNSWLSGMRGYSVVSLTGTVLADFDPSRIGQTTADHQGEVLRWGNVTGVQYQDANGETIKEYRVPLIAHKDHFASLHVNVSKVSFWTTFKQVATVAPAAILLPLALIAFGGLYLARIAKPMAGVDRQLRQVALQRQSVEPELQSLSDTDAVSLGWNRVVEAFHTTRDSQSSDGLQARLADIVASRNHGEMQTVLHNLSDGVAVTDVEGRITFANRAVTALLGTDSTNEELDGIELEAQIATEICDAKGGSLFDDQAELRPVVTEVQRQGDGEHRTLRVARRPMEGDGLRGHVWSVRDITQQKLAEKTRDQFIDVATHELRTPLSNIKAYAETLVTSDAIEVEQQKEFCNIINGEVTRLARFVDDLLSISSMEAGSLVIERQRTISSRLFDEVLAKVQPLMQKKAIDFIVQMPEKMADLELDKDKIVAVLVNLLGNAAKYTPESGRVTLRVKIDDSQLQVAVEDTGVGIAPDEVGKVFDKFFRSSDPRIQGETGTGLGLSLAREVVRMHGGDITVESQIDHGTTFVATIPIQ
ncbi:MAG: ATP-binding protein [Planctomycetota bacterium]